ncbi:uncharacterized protein LOC106472147 [Limulus polyphemus]|uniref:Uncharacterized protein LOC106472147 n=1 Tax=Limulus polyphemus TaxID=6850 RepID=A0ABM1TKP2_LIMPO|nr:uncharacterized protein LOC106472147 [Limulus polyphemus]
MTDNIQQTTVDSLCYGGSNGQPTKLPVTSSLLSVCLPGPVGAARHMQSSTSNKPSNITTTSSAHNDLLPQSERDKFSLSKISDYNNFVFQLNAKITSLESGSDLSHPLNDTCPLVNGVREEGMREEKKIPISHCSSSSVLIPQSFVEGFSFTSMGDEARNLSSVIKPPILESMSYKHAGIDNKREEERKENIQLSYKYQRDFSDDEKYLKAEKAYVVSENPSHYVLESTPIYQNLVDSLSGPSEDRQVQKLPPVSTIMQPHMAYLSRVNYKPFYIDPEHEAPIHETINVPLGCESPFLYSNLQETLSFPSHNLREPHKAVMKSSPVGNNFLGLPPIPTSDCDVDKLETIHIAHHGVSTVMTSTAENNENILVLPSTNPLLTPLDFGTTTYTSVVSSTPPQPFQSTGPHHCDPHNQSRCILSSSDNLSNENALNTLQSVGSIHSTANDVGDTLPASVSITASETVSSVGALEMPDLHYSRSAAITSPFPELCAREPKENPEIDLKSSVNVPVLTKTNPVLSSIKEEPMEVEVSPRGPFSAVSSENSMQHAVAQLPSMMTFFTSRPGSESDSQLLPPFYTVSGFTSLKKRDHPEALADSCPTIGRSSLTNEALDKIGNSSHIFSSTSVSTISPGLSGASTNIDTSSVPLNSVKCEVDVSTSQTVSTTLPVSKPTAVSTDKVRLSVSPGVVENSSQNDSSLSEKYCSLCQSGKSCELHIRQSLVTSTSLSEPSVIPASSSKPFRCNLCGKHLATKNVYQSHMRSHSGEKPFTCELCGHCFSQKTSLTRHMRSHTGERPFPCDICGKCFADKERIKIHMRTHTGEKPFSCTVCGKCFSQKSTVKRHMSVHTGEKPFVCQSCGKGFANKGNLNAHSKTHSST